MKKVDLDKILAENPQLDGERITALVKLRQRFQDIGHDLRPKYSVEPAFGALASVALGRNR
jgi:hypothetical protein